MGGAAAHASTQFFSTKSHKVERSMGTRPTFRQSSVGPTSLRGPLKSMYSKRWVWVRAGTNKSNRWTSPSDSDGVWYNSAGQTLRG